MQSKTTFNKRTISRQESYAKEDQFQQTPDFKAGIVCKVRPVSPNARFQGRNRMQSI